MLSFEIEIQQKIPQLNASERWRLLILLKILSYQLAKFSKFIEFNRFVDKLADSEIPSTLEKRHLLGRSEILPQQVGS
ncbi:MULTISPECIES: hypothetical protein [unclassified Microcoleus]|uniref:hypothetical protein n=1 Tax=unclassified Microcoleus TaxID=2642155 RepID=UPI002FCF35DE